MANRTYLYSLNHIPGTSTPSNIAGLSEWKYDIPLTYKILVSADPQLCNSAIWPDQGKIAIVADYKKGVQRLEQFLTQLDSALAKEHRQQTMAFLSNPEKQSAYILLEAGEIFDLQEDEELDIQCKNLLTEILSLESAIETFVSEFSQAPAKIQEKMLLTLGLCEWSDILYFDLSSSSDAISDSDSIQGNLLETLQESRNLKAISQMFDLPIRDACTGDSAFLADWPDLTITIEDDSPLPSVDADNEGFVWRCTAYFDGDGDGEEEDGLSIELLLELIDPDFPILNATWVLFPSSEVAPVIEDKRDEILRCLNDANLEYAVKFRLHQDANECYISSEIAIPVAALTADTISWMLSESLSASVRHFDALSTILAGEA